MVAAPGRPGLDLWTLQLAPKFNGYFADVLAHWQQQLQPHLPVRWTDLPWGAVERKLLAAVFRSDRAGCGEPQSTVRCQSGQQGWLTDLTPLLPEGTAERYLPAVWEACRDPEAGQIAVPWYLTVRLSLVNRQLLQAADLEAPPQRWSEVPAFARRIRERTGRYGLFVTAVPDDSAELLESLGADGGEIAGFTPPRAAFNSPAGRQAFRFWTDLYREGLLPREVVSQGQRRAIELFQSGDPGSGHQVPSCLRSVQTNAPGVASRDRAASTGHRRRRHRQCGLDDPGGAPSEPPARSLGSGALPDQCENIRPVSPQRPGFCPRLAGLCSRCVGPGGRSRPIRVRRSPDSARARLLSVEMLDRADVLVPALPGVGKRLQAIIYPVAALHAWSGGQRSGPAARRPEQWNRYAQARWP